MRQTKFVSLTVVAALAFSAGALAQEAAVTWLGAAPSHRAFEKFDMTIGVTAGQQPRRPVRIEEDRAVLHIPSHYGSVMAVTGDSHTAVLWYRSEDGSMRNVVVQSPDVNRFKVMQVPTSRYEIDNREQ
jgi:hypothetical protein